MGAERFSLYVYTGEPWGEKAVLARRRDSTTVEYVGSGTRGIDTIGHEGDVAEGLALVMGDHAERVRVQPALLQPGEYHPRIWRNGIPPGHQDDGDDAWVDPKLNPHICPVVPADELEALRGHVVAMHRIQQMVGEVFDVVTPCDANANAFGGAIRQVLLLAAVEVESMLTQTFAANLDPSVTKDRTTFNDWKQLFAPMKLEAWTVKLPAYSSWTNEIRPFALDPTNNAVPWWQAYNKAKHSPSEIHLANLTNMISAYAGVRVLLQAQFGPQVPRMLTHAGLAELEPTSLPRWPPSERYFSSLDGDEGYVRVRLNLR